MLTTALLSLVALTAEPSAEATDHQIVLTVQVKAEKPVTFTAKQISKLDHRKLEIGTGVGLRTYQGVPLAKILEAAGVDWGTKCSRWTDCYVLVGAADKYRAVFAVPEIDPGQAHKTVLLADRCDGKPLPEAVGSYQMIEQDAKQHGRWVRQVTTIHVRVAAD